ncbi:FeoC-like transcriptional regulator [Oscillatoria salina]|uniref:FeoC-like transcriptional regulator n=1 Tax=Oscillatoria salina TaxID=331517 RepID=UPI0013B883E1|nr:FeoC-like transcriptional regulator [Oscillatoria salina]MBZ8182890.1 hypothetical protein [Oscillatoria salina IIICB1]NET88931.1 hypothetical protein [Kamptonema sp. SIO1D9]
MILKELQEFVFKYHRVSLAEMELRFHIDGDALRQMLNKLVKKGRISKLPIPEHCHGCTSCNPDTIEFYEWVDIAYQNQDFSLLPENPLTKAQIHGIHHSEEDRVASEQTGIKYAVILDNCETNR